MKGVFSIGIDRRFADELARGVLAIQGDDPLSLADMLILVPTRRSVRALREAFLRAAGGRPTLLPRMAPLGDVDDGDWEIASGDSTALALPPAITPAEREALLARLVARFKDELDQPIAPSAAQALKLARELASLLDELAIDGVPFEKLETLVEGNFASHWQRTLRFLAIVGEHWPAILADRGQIDALDRRTRSIRLQVERWREKPPTMQVIAAGSTGSQPATRDLLSVIAGLPHGTVVLPGLDREMDDGSWAKLEPSHPQFGLRELLAALKLERRAVPDWPGGPGDAARRQLISELMRPAETSEVWTRPSAAALDHVTRADCATPHHEAVVIALAMRETLETKARTAALVTPDRDLARRVAAELRRWNIEVDDSAGQSLADTPPATLLRALVTSVDSGFAPVDLLALLKHPLCSLGLPRPALLDAARRLDRKVLRGLKPAPGLKELQELIAAKKFGDDADRRQVMDLIDRLDAAVADLVAAMANEATPHALIEATLATAEKLASAETLWAGDAGEALADALARLRDAWIDQPPISGGEWPALLATMLATETIRPRFGRHPRLAIWGPLEARLQRADLLILGGLNEGTWPPSVETGPWINRPMRAALGLPQPERRIGLSAHDFASALAAEGVLLTRAEREGGAPTVPSRWLARLDALFGYDPESGAPAPEYIQRGRHELLAWAEKLDSSDHYEPRSRPRPTPPIDSRPTRLTVSDIEQWRRDPYGLYARRILNLEALDPLEAELGAAERGSSLHAALDEFLKTYPSGLLPSDALRLFEQMGERHLEAVLAAPAERTFWWPRFQRLARWFIATENARRAAGTRFLEGETDGSIGI
ncbi:MAG: double-strand break repair protein AddB, partial [Rhodospirillales bacterium SCN 65-16]